MVEEVRAAQLSERFERVRNRTEYYCKPLTPEDGCIQSMPEVSPPNWHLAHTTWFFEHFLLSKFVDGYQAFHPQFSFIFNSYYETIGTFLEKPRRGNLSRPSLEEVLKYRQSVTERTLELIATSDENRLRQIVPILNLGIHHEEQHQELLLMDIKHIFASNPLRPIYASARRPTADAAVPWDMAWSSYPRRLVEIGFDAVGFCFDNERPSHSVLVEDFRLSSRLVTNAEYLQFMQDGGYARPEFWLSDGWAESKRQNWQAPLYWEKSGEKWQVATLSGFHPMSENEPVCHVSYYEAEAYARWAGKRLPTEAEWEVAAASRVVDGNLLESEYLHPVSLNSAPLPDSGPHQLFGDVWEWTQSAYLPYPGYRALEGSLGEYNGKFMCNQMVLRGGSCVTPREHIRATYRNFYGPASRWQFSGFRLSEDA